ncbi:glycoside hydrolase family 25 protein [Aureispira anguillae]|uniref:Glycoside hydrolase n=1 Tax=Aureispira anguillae TaxID=2864201 RepID=A0A915YKS7_9BACT|nr:GH25 family lysozyme [Aureispira anguillae]BDS14918.1 glycoside hydrolase [Aureispira anguillae]
MFKWIKSWWACFFFILLIACQHEADSYAIRGIDVSHYQQKINWQAVKKERDLHFVFIKATESVNYQDSMFQRNWKAAKEIGLKRGAYHFFRPNVSVEWQIKNFIQQVNLQKGDLPPVLDVEDIKNISMPKLIDRVGKWLMFIEEHYTIRPIIYASLDLYQKHLQAAFPNHIVWIARYNRTAPPADLQWKFWQYSDQTQINGIQGWVDQNVFVGTLDELNALCL